MLSRVRLLAKVTPTAKKFRAAGNLSRTAILYMLLREPLSLPVIRRRLYLSPALLAHHLNVLRRAGWVTKSKFGKVVSYMIREDALGEVKSFLQKSS